MKSNRTPVFYAAIVKNLIKKNHLLSPCAKYRNFTSNLGADILWKCTVYAEFSQFARESVETVLLYKMSTAET